MPIKAVCPECQTSYQLADQQAGKNVRCKECQTVFVVEETRKKPSSVTARRDAPSRLRRRDDDDEGDEPVRGRTQNVKKKKSALPWIVGGAVVGVVLLFGLCGAIAYMVWPNEKPKQAKSEPPPQFQNLPGNPPGGDQAGFQPPPGFVPPQMDVPPDEGVPVVVPPDNPTPQPPKADATPPKPADPKANAAKEARPAKADNGDEPRGNGRRITDADSKRVQRATVFIRVKLADGSQVSGSGFFGCKEAHNIVLTNAHVVGMLSPESMRPQDVEVVVNSGEANEWKTKARVLGVDRVSDLAVLDIGTPSQPVPEPLSVKSTDRLRHLDELYVFGFPLGEQLGKEITIRPASVSSFRREKNGTLRHVQVNGGMDHGNSGGPVVDNSGSVVGVAVSGFEGHQINFAIPGERVQAILSGRIADFNIEQPYFMSEKKVAVPVVVNMIDPRNLIKEVSLEVWTGNPPADPKKGGSRPAATTQPAPQEGDSPHKLIKLRYTAPEGKAQIVLPELPKGKVYWGQAKWTNNKGETHWGTAVPIQLPSAPVARKDANLVLHYTQGAHRNMELVIDNSFRISGTDDDDAFRIRTAATFRETVSNTGGGGTLLLLNYKFAPSCDLISPDGRSTPKPALESIKKEMPGAITSLLQLDSLGNIALQSIDTRSLRMRPQLSPKQVEAMKEYHEMIQQALEAVSVSMPPGGAAKPLHTWKGERLLPIDTPGKTLTGKIGVTFTYLGTRKRDGREEAVIRMDGQLRSRDESVGGKVEGRFLVDLANGQTLIADTTAKLQLKAILQRPGEQPHELRLLDTIKIHMQRTMK